MKNLFFVLFLCQFCLSNAQFVEPKFGKIEPSDLSMTCYDKDTNVNFAFPEVKEGSIIELEYSISSD